MTQHIVDTTVRHVILHYHIFKNAGTTIDGILEANFGAGFAHLHGRRHDSTVTNTDLFDFLLAYPEIRAVSSHHLRFPKPKSDTFVFFDAIFLRHPLDRLCSIYEFYRRAEESRDPLAEHARRLDLAGFMELLLMRYPHLVNDSQVNCLARGGQYTRPPSRTDLEKAHRIVTDAAIPGVIEILDVSLKAAEYYLCPAFGRLKLEYSRQNVSPGRAESLDVRLQRMEQACGQEIYRELREMNALDLELVEFASIEVRSRRDRIPALSRQGTGMADS
jgi:Sulfotransferase family